LTEKIYAFHAKSKKQREPTSFTQSAKNKHPKTSRTFMVEEEKFHEKMEQLQVVIL